MNECKAFPHPPAAKFSEMEDICQNKFYIDDNAL